MRNLFDTINVILEQIPTLRTTQEFTIKLVAIRDKAPFIPEEALEHYWNNLTDLIIETLHPELGGLQGWEQSVINKLLGV